MNTTQNAKKDQTIFRANLENAMYNAIQESKAQAHLSAHKRFAEIGERDTCGWAWIKVYGVRSNSFLGKTLIKYGFRKSGGELYFSDPSRLSQSISVSEASCDAFVKHFRSNFPEIQICVHSRMD